MSSSKSYFKQSMYCNHKDPQMEKLNLEIKDLKGKLEELSKEFERLQQILHQHSEQLEQILYQPGGPMYQAAKDEFDHLSKLTN